jgi:hypothetical protein
MIDFMTPLLINTQDAILLIGGADGLWKQALTAGWIVPAVKGRRHYFRYQDIEALAERFSRELPPPTPAQKRSLIKREKSWKKNQDENADDDTRI